MPVYNTIFFIFMLQIYICLNISRVNKFKIFVIFLDKTTK